jgi:hypothetical protein
LRALYSIGDKMVEVRNLELAKRNQIDANYWLHHWEEAVGPLEKIGMENGLLKVVIGKIILILPLEMERKLAPLMGKRIGILRMDILGKEYLVRSIPGKKTQALNEINVVDLTKQNTQREKANA